MIPGASVSMRITFLLPSLGVGGGIRVASIHARALQRRGHQVVAVVPPPAPKALGDRVRALFDPDAPRLPECAEEVILAGVAVPLVRLWPDSPSLPVRAEWALAAWPMRAVR